MIDHSWWYWRPAQTIGVNLRHTSELWKKTSVTGECKGACNTKKYAQCFCMTFKEECTISQHAIRKKANTLFWHACKEVPTMFWQECWNKLNHTSIRIILIQSTSCSLSLSCGKTHCRAIDRMGCCQQLYPALEPEEHLHVGVVHRLVVHSSVDHLQQLILELFLQDFHVPLQHTCNATQEQELDSFSTEEKTWYHLSNKKQFISSKIWKASHVIASVTLLFSISTWGKKFLALHTSALLCKGNTQCKSFLI